MKTPVCAHMNLGPHVNVYKWCDSIGEAIASFRDHLIRHYGTLDKSIGEIRGPDEMPCVDLYAPACNNNYAMLHCNTYENFHDYPFARYQVGPRGGIRKVPV